MTANFNGWGSLTTRGKYSDILDSEDLLASYDATEIDATDGDSISTWFDLSGNGYDLTAGTAPTYVGSKINGNSTVSFDGTDDMLSANVPLQNQPNSIFVVFTLDSLSGNNTIFDSNSSTDRHVLYESNDTWTFGAGNFTDGSAADQNNHIASAFYDGANSKLRIDGVDDITADAGAQSLDGFRLGAYNDLSTYGNVDVGEVLIYPEDKSNIQSDVESYLSDKWGITI